jgi:hypothetical protein
MQCKEITDDNSDKLIKKLSMDSVDRRKVLSFDEGLYA